MREKGIKSKGLVGIIELKNSKTIYDLSAL